MITDLNGTTIELSGRDFTTIAPASTWQLSPMEISLPTKTPHHSSIQRTHNYYNTVTFFPIYRILINDYGSIMAEFCPP